MDFDIEHLKRLGLKKTVRTHAGEDELPQSWAPGSREERHWFLQLRMDVLNEAEQQEVQRYVEARQPNKKLAYALWLVTGLIGGHRYYLHSYFWGAAMAALLLAFPYADAAWWLIDGIRMSSLIDDRLFVLTDAAVKVIEHRHIELAMAAADGPLTVRETDVLPVELWFPENTDLFRLVPSETIFLKELYRHMKKAGLPTNAIKAERLEDGGIAVAYDGANVGIVNLQAKKHTMTVPFQGMTNKIEGELPNFLSYLSVWIEKMGDK